MRDWHLSHKESWYQKTWQHHWECGEEDEPEPEDGRPYRTIRYAGDTSEKNKWRFGSKSNLWWR